LDCDVNPINSLCRLLKDNALNEIGEQMIMYYYFGKIKSTMFVVSSALELNGIVLLRTVNAEVG